ncbi:hypothetical protein PENTCL1PPCAC_957, partial [Pristionchus entomophagus]
FCVIRMAAASITPAVVLVHSSITIQQVFQILSSCPEECGQISDLYLSSQFCYVVMYGVFSFDKETLGGKTQFCPAFNQNNEVFIISNLNLMMVLDITNSICTLLLFRYNTISLLFRRHRFDLKRTFESVQNLYAIKKFIPIMGLHAITQLIHFGLYSFTYSFRANYSLAQFTIVYAVVNIIPYYYLLSHLTFLILTKLGRFRRQDRVNHLIASTQSNSVQE